MSKKSLFRVGKVSCYLRGCTWYLRYHEHGCRRQVRASTDLDATRQLAAQVNAQLETGAPAAISYEPITIAALRDRWLEHHEHVLRSSMATVDRYRTATEHLIRFLNDEAVLKRTANFAANHAERFAHYLRAIQVAPNGHQHAAKRPLRDKGIKYILETCRTMFNYAAKRRHLPPYADNPFTVIEIDRIPVEDAKPFVDLPPEKERQLLETCDDWQFPIFATLMLTGLRPGELTRLLLPDDLDLLAGWLYVRNKPDLGWHVKTRNERRIPLLEEHVTQTDRSPRSINVRAMKNGFPCRWIRCVTAINRGEAAWSLSARCPEKASVFFAPWPVTSPSAGSSTSGNSCWR
ncbi:MAG: phage integrase SAM-like domain-containing protein [Phycisphaeraceae bacterium]|nr:phage integrase SAM-like domain-containing protein [Phycisphaeraceae bacterium]